MVAKPASFLMSIPTSPLVLAPGVYLSKVLGVWIGKFIGGTLGAPVEGVKEAHSFASTSELPTSMAENDDTDLQLLWLHALEHRGVALSAQDMMAEWQEHVRAPWNEYAVARANWERGILPPDSGRVNNWFYGECMGCPIRAEIWGLVSPGAPALAARYAAMDGSLDHFGDAVEAEKFLAAMVSGLFFEKDVRRLVASALGQVDPGSRFHQLVCDVVAWSERYPDWRDARALVLQNYGQPEMTHVLQNLGFTLIGLLYGRGDFAETTLIALNCGYDADCTAGSACAIIGGIVGYEGIPERWRASAGDRYVISDCMLGFPRAGSIRMLARSTCAIGRRVATQFDTGVEIEPDPAGEPLPLAVVPQQPLPPTSGARPFATWRIVGPFWRNWQERREQDYARGEHGIPGLPSAQYMSHAHSGFDVDFLDAASLTLDGVVPGRPREWVRLAADDRVPLDDLADYAGPCCYYAVTSFVAPTSRRLWLMIGSTGPVEAWLNGRQILRSESYQPLTPNSFVVEADVPAGGNRLVLKLARTSQTLGAYVGLKRSDGRHWHQSFFDTSLHWQSRPSSST